MQILLIEDDYETRICLAEFLRDHGHSVTEMDTASEAMVRDFLEMDLIISDIHMNGLSGMDLLKKTRRNSAASFILMTAYDECMEDLVKVNELGADCLLKPIDLDQFAELVEKAAHKPESKEGDSLS